MKIEPDRSKLPIEPDKPDYAEEIARKTAPPTLDQDLLEQGSGDADPFHSGIASRVEDANPQKLLEAAQRKFSQEAEEILGQAKSSIAGAKEENSAKSDDGRIQLGGGIYIDEETGSIGYSSELGHKKQLVDGHGPEAEVSSGQFGAGVEMDINFYQHYLREDIEYGGDYLGEDIEAYSGVGFSVGGRAQAGPSSGHAGVEVFAGFGGGGGLNIGEKDGKLVLDVKLGIALGIGVGVDIGIAYDPALAGQNVRDWGELAGETAAGVGEWLSGLGEAATGASAAASAAGDTAGDVVDEVVDTAEDAGEAASDFVEDGKEAAADAISDAADW